LLSM
jgi:hypothetical protein